MQWINADEHGPSGMKPASWHEVDTDDDIEPIPEREILEEEIELEAILKGRDPRSDLYYNKDGRDHEAQKVMVKYVHDLMVRRDQKLREMGVRGDLDPSTTYVPPHLNQKHHEAIAERAEAYRRLNPDKAEDPAYWRLNGMPQPRNQGDGYGPVKESQPERKLGEAYDDGSWDF